MLSFHHLTSMLRVCVPQYQVQTAGSVNGTVTGDLVYSVVPLNTFQSTDPTSASVPVIAPAACPCKKTVTGPGSMGASVSPTVASWMVILAAVALLVR